MFKKGIEGFAYYVGTNSLAEVATKQEALQLTDSLPGTWAHPRRGTYRVLPLDARRAKTVTSAQAPPSKSRAGTSGTARVPCG